MQFFTFNSTDEEIKNVYEELKRIYKDNPEQLEIIKKEIEFLKQYEPMRFSKEILNKDSSHKAKYIWEIKDVMKLHSMIKQIERNTEYKRNLKHHLKVLIDLL